MEKEDNLETEENRKKQKIKTIKIFNFNKGEKSAGQLINHEKKYKLK